MPGPGRALDGDRGTGAIAGPARTISAATTGDIGGKSGGADARGRLGRGRSESAATPSATGSAIVRSTFCRDRIRGDDRLLEVVRASERPEPETGRDLDDRGVRRGRPQRDLAVSFGAREGLEPITVGAPTPERARAIAQHHRPLRAGRNRVEDRVVDPPRERQHADVLAIETQRTRRDEEASAPPGHRDTGRAAGPGDLANERRDRYAVRPLGLREREGRAVVGDRGEHFAIRLPPALGREQVGERVAVDAPAHGHLEARVRGRVLDHQSDGAVLQSQDLTRQLGAFVRPPRGLVGDAPLARARRRPLDPGREAGDPDGEHEPSQPRQLRSRRRRQP